MRPSFYMCLALGTITIVGLGLRLWNVSDQSFWYDESYTYMVAGFDWYRIAFVPLDVHPPLYHLIVKLVGFGSDVESSLRNVSVVAGTLTIPVMWLIGRRVHSQKVAVIAAILLAFNPAHIDYSQEARSYTLIMLLLCLCMLFSLSYFQRAVLVSRVDDRGLEGSGRCDLILYAVCALLALHTHAIAAIFLAVLNASVLLGALIERVKWNSRDIRFWVLANVFVGALYLPWLLSLIGTSAAFSWLTHITPFDFLYTTFNWFGYETLPLRANLFLAGALAAGAVLLIYQRRYASTAVLLAFASAPFLIWLIGYVKPIFMTRTVLPALAAWIILQAILFASFRSRIITLACVVLASGLSVVGTVGLFAGTSKFAKYNPDLRVVSQVIRNRPEREGVLFSCSKQLVEFSPYFSNQDTVYVRALDTKRKDLIIKTNIDRYFDFYRLPVREQKIFFSGDDVAPFTLNGAGAILPKYMFANYDTVLFIDNWQNPKCTSARTRRNLQTDGAKIKEDVVLEEGPYKILRVELIN